jgi:hypothetical protein
MITLRKSKTRAAKPHPGQRGRRDEVVIVAAEELRCLQQHVTGETLVAAMRASPYRRISLDPKNLGPEGARLPVRAVVL